MRSGLQPSLPRCLASALVAALLGPATSFALRYGPITVTGNVETQNILRVPEIDAWSFVQQRNTFRLEYSQELVRQGGLIGSAVKGWTVPFISSARFLTYYRLVYDTIYDIAPGPFQEATDGSRGPGIEAIRGSARSDVALENRIRELYVDFDLAHLPVTFRIGKQQIVWGNANLNQRALDSVNALDLGWHFNVETGVGSRVGFSELRRTAWTAKAIVNVGDVGPLANVFFEVYDIPFDFKQTKVRFLPYPWSFPGRDPFRGGQAIDVSGAFGAPPGTALVEPCFDFTGNPAPNGAAMPDFTAASATGQCPTPGRARSRPTEGLYDPRDPFDVNQVGGRIGALGPYSIGFTLNYMYRRAISDVAGTSTTKQPASGLTAANPAQYITVAPHASLDRATGQQRGYVGFFRVPIEFYMPYVHVFGLTLDYFDGDFSQAVWNAEMAWTHNNPIASRDVVEDPNGIRRTDMVTGAVSIDRPTWIRPLNKGRVFDVQGQFNFTWQPFHEDVRVVNGQVVEGFVGTPASTTIPGQFRDEVGFDRLKGVEILTAVVMNTSYWGGSLIPAVAWISDWTTVPNMRWDLILQYLPNPYLLLETQLRINWTNGRTVDDRYSVGRMTRRDELVLKATYQF